VKKIKYDTIKNDTERIDDTVVGTGQSMALTIDYDLYAQYLEDSDLSEDQKREFIETLWSVIVSFVDLGFGVHPLQQAASDRCGPNGKLPRADFGDVIELPEHLPHNAFIKAADLETHDRGKGRES